MKRLAIATILVATLSVPAFAGEVPTVGVVTPQPSPQPTTQATTPTTSSSIATTILLTLLSLGLVRR